MHTQLYQHTHTQTQRTTYLGTVECTLLSKPDTHTHQNKLVTSNSRLQLYNDIEAFANKFV